MSKQTFKMQKISLPVINEAVYVRLYLEASYKPFQSWLKKGVCPNNRPCGPLGIAYYKGT